ncbi:hypothetical protein BH09BAC1_BH09BAC1_08210 [soil metagenome]
MYIYLIKAYQMIIKLSKNASKKDIEQALLKLKKKKQSDKKSSQYFGSLKRGLDGMEYQNAVRNEWT